MADIVAGLNSKVIAATRAQDAKAFANLYTSDIRLLMEDTPVIIGRDAALKEIEKLWGEGVCNMTVDSKEVIVAGSYVIDTGEYVMLRKDGSAFFDGKYTQVLKQEGGAWKVYIDTNCSNPKGK